MTVQATYCSAGFTKTCRGSSRADRHAQALASVIDGPLATLIGPMVDGVSEKLWLPEANIAITALTRLDHSHTLVMPEDNAEHRLDLLLIALGGTSPRLSAITHEGFSADDMTLWLATLGGGAWLLPPSDDHDFIELAAGGFVHHAAPPYRNEEGRILGLRNASRLFAAAEKGWF